MLSQLFNMFMLMSTVDKLAVVFIILVVVFVVMVLVPSAKGHFTGDIADFDFVKDE